MTNSDFVLVPRQTLIDAREYFSERALSDAQRPNGNLEMTLMMEIDEAFSASPVPPSEPVGWRPMDSAPRDGTHFLALERIGIENTPNHVLEWREIWFEPKRWFLQGQSTWLSQAGEAQFGEDCFVGWMPLPSAPGSVPPSPPRDEVVEALRELLTATIADCGDPDDFPSDDGGVATYSDGRETVVTFAIIRRARAALAGLGSLAKALGETT